MFRKLLSFMLAILMLVSVSAAFVSAEETSGTSFAEVSSSDEATKDEAATDDEISSVDEARESLLALIESVKDTNENYFTEESYEIFRIVLEEAMLVADDDLISDINHILYHTDQLVKAYDALEGLILGDANGDRVVNIKDATEIQKYLADLIELSEGRLLCADVDCDEKNNIKDATYIQKYVAGLIDIRKNRFLHKELYVIELTKEYTALHDYAFELTCGNKFEPASYFDFREVCHTPIGDSPQSIKAAMKELRQALVNLVAMPEIPEVPAQGKLLEFDAEYDFMATLRHNMWENAEFVVNSPEELQLALEQINTDYFYNDQKVLPEEYDDAFFEEKAVIMSVFDVGDLGGYQSVDYVTAEGNVLTIYRTIVKPYLCPPMKESRLTYIEVKKSDIEGITEFKHVVHSYIIGDDGSINP